MKLFMTAILLSREEGYKRAVLKADLLYKNILYLKALKENERISDKGFENFLIFLLKPGCDDDCDIPSHIVDEWLLFKKHLPKYTK